MVGLGGALCKARGVPFGQVTLVGPEDFTVLAGNQLRITVLRRFAVDAVEVVAPGRALAILLVDAPGILPRLPVRQLSLPQAVRHKEYLEASQDML